MQVGGMRMGAAIRHRIVKVKILSPPPALVLRVDGWWRARSSGKLKRKVKILPFGKAAIADGDRAWCGNRDETAPDDGTGWKTDQYG